MRKVLPRIKHILLNSEIFRLTHPKYYQTSNTKDLFKNTKLDDILSFLKNILIKIWRNQTFY